MPTLDEVLATHLEDEQLEELVCVYLQNRFGYLVREDYLLCHPEREAATVQVRARPPRLTSSRVVERIYTFRPEVRTGRPDTVEVDHADLIDFIVSERWSLPLGVAEWVSLALDGAQASPPAGEERRFTISSNASATCHSNDSITGLPSSS